MTDTEALSTLIPEAVRNAVHGAWPADLEHVPGCAAVQTAAIEALATLAAARSEVTRLAEVHNLTLRAMDDAARAERAGAAHVFRDLDPEALCPTCGFPSWTHDPATAFLYHQPIRAETGTGLDVELLAEAIDAAWDSPIYPPIEPVAADHNKLDGEVRRLSLGPVKAGRDGWFQLRPTPGLPGRIAAEYARLSPAPDPEPETALRAAPSFASVRKAITDSYYDTRNEGGTMETAADLAATRVLNLWSQRAALEGSAR